MSPEWKFLLDTVVRWLPYIGVVIFIPVAVMLGRCLSKGACRNGPVQKINSYADEEYGIGPDATFRYKNRQNLKVQSANRHKSLPDMQDNYSTSDVFRSVSLTREDSGICSALPNKLESLNDDTGIGPGICSLCQMVYTETKVARNLPCSHHFHQKCAEDWFSKRGYCPQCIRPSSVSVIKG